MAAPRITRGNRMNEFLNHPWVRVLLIATTVAMATLALRETASITLPIVTALRDVLLPVAIGFTIAYVLTPIVDGLQRRGFNRTFAAGVLFGLFCVSVVVGVSLVVPTVLRQTTTLATRLFEGEKYTDLNGNGRWDPGEPYEDSNGNGRYDAQGMLASALNWVEERQGRLRQIAKLELDQPALSFLALLQAETSAERKTIDDALKVAHDDRPPDQWPEALRHEPPPDAPLSWNAVWPGTVRSAVDDAYGKLPPEVRERWIRNLSVAGLSYSTKQSELLAALRQVRHGQASQDHAGPESAAKEMAARSARLHQVSETLTAPASEEQRAAASAFATHLADEEKAGGLAAKDLLAELRGEDSSSQWLAPVVKALETSVKGAVDSLPARIGGWATTGLASIDTLLAVGLDVLLVPIYAFFLILAMPAIRRGVKQYLPQWHREQVLRIVRDIERVVAAFFRGRLIVCLICGVATWIGFISIGFFGPGVPYALLFAVLIGLSTAIPLAGFLFLIPAVVMTLLDGGTPLSASLVIGVYALVQLLEMLVLTPGIMGHEVELHPVTLIVALLLCGKLVGILGLILAVPIAATGRILAREFLWPWLKQWADQPRPPPP
jgi:predicted PurR-regulated permease PerM